MSQTGRGARSGLTTALAILAVALVGAGPLAGQELPTGEPLAEPFPHADHQGLFPVCTGCHAGIETGEEPLRFPEPASCLGCHDGEQQERVEWDGPSDVITNLEYEHAGHAAELEREGEAPLDCASCHRPPDGARMSVERAVVGSCLGCHEHEAEAHMVDADCATCHVPLAETRFNVERIAGLEVPSDHQTGAFILEHAPATVDLSTRCATCHVQDRCASCHVEAGLPEIEAVPAAPASMDLPPFVAHYPLPLSHAAPRWWNEHADVTWAGESCSTCHTQNDCTSCHVQPAPDPVTALPERAQVQAPGVGVRREEPETHVSPWFEDEHVALAASAPGQCATCHTQASCQDCHAAARNPGFHPPDFVAQHAADAWGQTMECANCHNTVVFCRNCHLDLGLEGEGRLGPGFHDAEPLFLLRHGQAARQGLESCVSCHTQKDCTQCHSQLGAWKISPHGRDFDARRAWETNPRTCFACHLGNPLGTGP